MQRVLDWPNGLEQKAVELFGAEFVQRPQQVVDRLV
jgi:hypothetical protein